MHGIGWGRVARVGLIVGLGLNVTGWLGNNLLLGSLWDSVEPSGGTTEWRLSIWSDVFSLVPDFLYGVAIAWLCVTLRPQLRTWPGKGLAAGTFVAAVGGITTYFALANSGFIPWSLAMASFLLVLATKIPLAFVAARMLDRP